VKVTPINLLQWQSLCNTLLSQLTASPWTTEASTRERWQFGALSWFAATETGSIMSRTRVSRMKMTATKRTPFTWLLNHLFIHTSLCDSGRRTRRQRMVHAAISRIAKRCFRVLTVNITLWIEGGRRQKLSQWLSHRQSLALGSV